MKLKTTKHLAILNMAVINITQLKGRAMPSLRGRADLCRFAIDNKYLLNDYKYIQYCFIYLIIQIFIKLYLKTI